MIATINSAPRQAAPAPAYALGHSASETRRLMLQHQIYGPITRRLFEAAGIGAGMRILDVGSGAGDVALLLADLVGPRGEVVGIDRNAVILETARERARTAGWRNVSFEVGDLWQAPLDRPFDAIVGRWILMYLPEPAAMLRYLATGLRAGGIMAFHESDFSYPPTMFPASELDDKIRRWGIPSGATKLHGPEMRMGANLFRVYQEAGLPGPELRMEAPIGGGPDWPGYEYVAETLRSLLPMLQQTNGLDPAEVQIDTLADRIRADALAGGRVQQLPMTVGAWARKAA